MFKKVETKLDFVQDELDTIKFWEDKDIFKKCLDNTKRNKEYVFYDGPPTANGKPHIGHVLTRTVKDVIPRYKTMKGFHVQRKAGWDTHGLPVELEVEKELGFTNKDDILKYGIVPFIEKCKVSVWKYKNEWEQMSKRVGYWVDFERPYITYTDDYIESIWWAFKKIDEKGLLYDGFKILPYCPRCGTSLSSHEVDQNYKTVKEVSIFVKFKVKNEKNSFILAWTTTPWTLPSNVALCVNPTNDYVQIKVENEKYILAENLVATLFEKYEVIKKFKGKDIEYLEYEPLFVSKIKLKQKAFYITCDEYVTLDSGTGVVHLAPAFGEDDAKVGSKYNLPFLQLVNSKGEFVKESEFADMPVKKANVAVIENLKSRNLLFKELMFEHNYPHCWRCDTPLIYYANKSWFVKMSAVKDNLVANNQKVNWLPPAFKNGRMGNFLENVKDWCISRNRYWGTPLPVWKCECGHHHVVGSKKELFELTQKTIPELHKPYIDELQIVCEKCGKLMSREPEVIDCWFDSGSMPFAQLHYPFENKKEFKKLFPADFISEGSDQSRGWFYSLQALSTVLFGTTPYKSCIALGLINDKNGIKMSKHLGNVITPNEMLDSQGADAVRWYFCSASAPWLSTRFSKEAVEEAKRNFMGTLWNTYYFFVLYANIDKFNPKDYKLSKCKLSMMDKWILSELNSLNKNVDTYLNDLDIFKTSRSLSDFVDTLSNWYVRRSRKRFWGSGMEEDKVAAYMTLYTVLVNLVKMLAPICPFISENIYQNLVCTIDSKAPISVHLCSWPKFEKKYINKKLESKMNTVYKTVELGRACRNVVNIKNRQPLNKIYVHSSASHVIFDDEMLKNIKEELNIDSVEVLENVDDWVKYVIKPQLKTLGPKYGKYINSIKDYLANCDAKTVLADLDKNGVFKAKIEDIEVVLEKDDLLITKTNKEGSTSMIDGDLSVVLDTEITEDLLHRGYVLDLVSKLQNLRKTSNFEVEERINIYIKTDETMTSILKEYFDLLSKDLLAKNIEFCDKITEFNTELDLDNHKIIVSIEK